VQRLQHRPVWPRPSNSPVDIKQFLHKRSIFAVCSPRLGINLFSFFIHTIWALRRLKLLELHSAGMPTFACAKAKYFFAYLVARCKTIKHVFELLSSFHKYLCTVFHTLWILDTEYLPKSPGNSPVGSTSLHPFSSRCIIIQALECRR
jgi:hypothetical protein